VSGGGKAETDELNLLVVWSSGCGACDAVLSQIGQPAEEGVREIFTLRLDDKVGVAATAASHDRGWRAVAPRVQASASSRLAALGASALPHLMLLTLDGRLVDASRLLLGVRSRRQLIARLRADLRLDSAEVPSFGLVPYASGEDEGAATTQVLDLYSRFDRKLAISGFSERMEIALARDFDAWLAGLQARTDVERWQRLATANRVYCRVRSDNLHEYLAFAKSQLRFGPEVWGYVLTFCDLVIDPETESVSTMDDIRAAFKGLTRKSEQAVFYACVGELHARASRWSTAKAAWERAETLDSKGIGARLVAQSRSRWDPLWR